MKVIKLILLLPLDIVIVLGILIGLLVSKIDEILKMAVIWLIDFKQNILKESETTETSEVK